MFSERNRKFYSQGFTLLEVMIAMAIMTLAFASILAVEQGSINASARAKQMNVVGMLARNKMVETEFKIEGKTFEEAKKEDAGTFAEPYTDYRWKAVIKEMKFPELGMGSGSKDPGSKDQSGSQTQSSEMVGKMITKYLSKAIREVNVTVFWKRGSGEQSYTLSTYWVNLNNELQISQ